MDIKINMLPNIDNIKEVCFDLEMYNQMRNKLHIPHGTFAGLAVVTEEEKIWITDSILLNPLFERLKKVERWVLQNSLYDLIQLSQMLYIEPHPIYDTMLIERILFNNYYDSFSLKSMVRRYYSEILEKDKYESIGNATIDLQELAHYAITDAIWTLKVYKKQMNIIEPDLLKVYETIDAPMIWVVLNMQRPKIDVAAWLKNAELMEMNAYQIESELGINTKSSKQVSQFLTNLLKREVASSKAEVLESYKDNPVVAKIIEARMYRTAMGTFGKKWITNHVLSDDTVQSSWQIIGAETGRMSSKEPNLQNIPSRKLPQYRDFFIARPNHKLIVADVSQQEPRILAYISKDKNLKHYFQVKDDIHLAVTRKIFNNNNLTHESPERKIGKAINLGTSYGLTSNGLAERLNISLNEAETFINQYFANFPDVHQYILLQRRFAERKEYVLTPYGRKIWINIHNPQWQNNAINAPIQGGGADMTKLWMVKLFDLCSQVSLTFPVTMVIHDELVLDVPEAEVEGWLAFLRLAFNEAVSQLFPDLDFPFEFEFAVGDKWSIKS